MIEVFYRYRVHPTQAKAFEHAHGPSGPWSKLFAGHAGYRRSRLFRHRADPGIYLTADVWESKGAWDDFRAASGEAYARFDRELRLLYLEEHFLGYYEGTDEYRVPLDTRA